MFSEVHFASIAEEAWSLEDTLATLTARFHKKALLEMYVWTDDRDSRRHIIYVRSFLFPLFNGTKSCCFRGHLIFVRIS